MSAERPNAPGVAGNSDTVERQAIVERLAAEMVRLIDVEAGQNGQHGGERMALGAVVGGLNWLTANLGDAYTLEALQLLHEAAVEKAALGAEPAGSGALN